MQESYGKGGAIHAGPELCVASREAVVAENILLRHQLAVLTRSTRKRPRLRTRDKLFWMWSMLSTVTGAGTWSWSDLRASSAGTARRGASSGAGVRAGQSVARESVPRSANSSPPWRGRIPVGAVSASAVSC